MFRMFIILQFLVWRTDGLVADEYLTIYETKTRWHQSTF
jgi:hypothetical protein